jgi:hypothetical protein
MFNNIFSTEPYHPKGAYEIEQHIRAREKQRAIASAEYGAEDTNSLLEAVEAPDTLFERLFSISKTPYRQPVFAGSK